MWKYQVPNREEKNKTNKRQGRSAVTYITGNALMHGPHHLSGWRHNMRTMPLKRKFDAACPETRVILSALSSYQATIPSLHANVETLRKRRSSDSGRIR
jgi:hypothetical protein